MKSKKKWNDFCQSPSYMRRVMKREWDGRGTWTLGGVDSVYSDLVQDPWDGGALPLGTGRSGGSDPRWHMTEAGLGPWVVVMDPWVTYVHWRRYSEDGPWLILTSRVWVLVLQGSWTYRGWLGPGPWWPMMTQAYWDGGRCWSRFSWGRWPMTEEWLWRWDGRSMQDLDLQWLIPLCFIRFGYVIPLCFVRFG